MEIKTIVMAGGPLTSLIILKPKKDSGVADCELPIRIGAIEAASIITGINGIQERPKTHDLLLSLISSLGGLLKNVAIVDVHNSTFYAVLTIDDMVGKRILIDCRPSDALALAMRKELPIYAEEKVLQAATLPNFEGVERDEQRLEMQRFHDFIEHLSADDFNSTEQKPE